MKKKCNRILISTALLLALTVASCTHTNTVHTLITFGTETDPGICTGMGVCRASLEQPTGNDSSINVDLMTDDDVPNVLRLEFNQIDLARKQRGKVKSFVDASRGLTRYVFEAPYVLPARMCEDLKLPQQTTITRQNPVNVTILNGRIKVKVDLLPVTLNPQPNSLNPDVSVPQPATVATPTPQP